jgi:hypothetical protein
MSKQKKTEKYLFALLSAMVSIVLWWPQYSFAAVSQDSVSSGSNSNLSDTLTVSHTVGGSDTALICTVWQNNATDLLSGVTYNGVALTQLDSFANSASNTWFSDWYLVAPDTGTHDVVFTALINPTNLSAMCESLDGVNQSSPVEDHQYSTGAPGTLGTESVDLTISTDSGQVSVGHGAGDAVVADPAGATVNTTLNNAAQADNFGSASGSHTITWQNSGNVSLSVLGVSFMAATAGGGGGGGDLGTTTWPVSPFATTTTWAVVDIPNLDFALGWGMFLVAFGFVLSFLKQRK